MLIVNKTDVRIAMRSLTVIGFLLAASASLLAQESVSQQQNAARQQAAVRSDGEPAADEAVRIQRHPAAVQRRQCFPIEDLPENLQSYSKTLLLDALDSEALYTLVGDLKPVSEGFFDTWFETDPADTKKISKARRAISAWQCGGHYEVGVSPFQKLRDGKRFASAWIASRPGLKNKLDDRHDFFGRLGMTMETSPVSDDELSKETSRGVLVKSVSSNSLAEKSGLQAGDRIVRLGEREVSGVDELKLMLAQIKRPGSHRLDVHRFEANDATLRSELILYLNIPPWITQTDKSSE